MKQFPFPRIHSLVELYDILPEEERLIVDILRQIAAAGLPAYCTEKMSYNVPYFYGNRRICMIWPATVPMGGVRKGVLFGFSYGNRLQDEDQYLEHGRNKQVFYKIYQSADAIDEGALFRLLKEAAEVDKGLSKK